jgi:hypothetical protein
LEVTTVKKVFGYFFIVLAALFALAALAQLASLLSLIGRTLILVTGALDAYESGKVGSLIFWILYFTAIFLLVKFGSRWITKTATKSTSEETTRS